jgi:hypothetical protein
MRSQALHLTPLSNEEFIQFFVQLLATVDNGDIPLPAALHGACIAAERHLAGIRTLYRRDKAPRLTAKIVAADGRRDDLVLALQDLCEGHTYNPDERLREAAILLDVRLEAYGPRTRKLNYKQETGIIYAIVHDCREDFDCAAAVSALGLENWIDALDAVNREFERLYAERIAYNTENDLPYTLIEKREQMKEAYQNLLNKLDGFYHTAEGAEPWNRMVKMVDVLTQEYREILAARKEVRLEQLS